MDALDLMMGCAETELSRKATKWLMVIVQTLQKYVALE